MNQVIIFCAKYLFLLSLVVTAVCWLVATRPDKKLLAIRVVGGGILALILAKIASHLYNDPRPFVSDHITPLISHAADNGFPSDHTLITSLLAFAVLTVSKKAGIGLLVVALIVGSSRVMAGIHHPIDILGSFIVSAVAVAIVLGIERLVTSRRQPETDKTA